jgi:hypothetical protein
MHDGRLSTILVVTLILCGSMLDKASADGDGSKGEDSPKQLSVAPMDHIVYPDDRPTWVSDPVKQQDNEATFVVVSGPCDTPEESLRELNLMRRAALSTYISRITNYFGIKEFYDISDERIDQDFVMRRYSGEIIVGGTSQYEDAVEIRVTESERKLILDAWQNIEVFRRLQALGVAMFGGLAVLVVSSTAIGVVARRQDRKQQPSQTSA